MFRFSIDGQPFTAGVLVNIEQQGSHVVGNYAGAAQRGSLAFDLADDGQIVNGAIGIDSPSADPNVRCRGTGAITGTVSPFVLRSLVVPLVNCTGAMTGLLLSMTR